MGMDGIFGLMDRLNPLQTSQPRANPPTLPTATPQTVAQTPQDQWRRMMMARMLMNHPQQQATTPSQSLANAVGQMGDAWWANRMFRPDTANNPTAQNPTQPQTPSASPTATTTSGVPVSIGPFMPFGMGGGSPITRGPY